jgi:hypothetical protein
MVKETNSMEKDKELYSIETSIDGIRVIHLGLALAVKHWSGGDPQEQIELVKMKENFYRMILDYQFESS